MAKIPRVPVENQITTLSVVKIAIKFSPCKKSNWKNQSFEELFGAMFYISEYFQIICIILNCKIKWKWVAHFRSFNSMTFERVCGSKPNLVDVFYEGGSINNLVCLLKEGARDIICGHTVSFMHEYSIVMNYSDTNSLFGSCLNISCVVSPFQIGESKLSNYSPHSPVASSDSYLFPKFKNFLAGKKLESNDQYP